LERKKGCAGQHGGRGSSPAKKRKIPCTSAGAGNFRCREVGEGWGGGEVGLRAALSGFFWAQEQYLMDILGGGPHGAKGLGGKGVYDPIVFRRDET